MSEHARLSASSAHRWMNCAGSARMEHGLPDVDTEYNVEGRAAHQYASDLLDAYFDRAIAYAAEKVRVRLKEGGYALVDVTNEMRRAVGVYFDYVRDSFVAAGTGARLYVEQRVSLDRLDPPEEMFGTADTVIVGPGLIHVIDFKYGTGVVVEVKENPQLMEYALATNLTLDTAAVAGLDPMFRTTIVQPRAEHTDGPIRSYEYTFAELRDFGHRLMNGARAAHAPDAPLLPGPWCRWCKAAGFCPALAKASQAAAQADFGIDGNPHVNPAVEGGEVVHHIAPVDVTQGPFFGPIEVHAGEATGVPATPANGAPSVVLAPIPDAEFEVLPPDPDRLPVAVVAKVLEKAELIEGFLAAVRERARREIMDGRDVPGWKLVEGRPVREWIDEKALEKWARTEGVLHGSWDGELFKHVARSPAEIEKIVGKKNLPPELWRKVSKSVKLAPVSDSRPAVASRAQDDFGALSPAPESPSTEGGKEE